MALQDEPLGDVIDISSSDEGTASQRRSLDTDSPQLPDDHVPAPKRLKTASEASSGKQVSEEMSTAEEGEIETDSGQADDQQSSYDASAMDVDRNEQAPTPSSCVFMPSQPPIFKTYIEGRDLDLKLPVFSQKRQGTWDDRFLDWTRAFCTANIAQAARMTSATVLGGYNFYLDQSSGLKTKKKKLAKLAAKASTDHGQVDAVIKEISSEKNSAASAGPDPSVGGPKGDNPDPSAPGNDQASESEEEYEPKIEDPSQSDPEKAGTATGSANDQSRNGEASQRTEVSASEMAQLRKYFPSATDPSSMCLLCGRQGHTSASCSSASCKFCHAAGHWDFVCPARTRCSKCRQLGHSSEGCAEKLVLSKGEGLACCFCGSADHLEDECTEIWRSFVPEEATVKVVAFIAPSCSLCGSTQHYSSDCADSRRGSPRNPTWSLRNHDRYVQGGCESLSIEDAAAQSSSANKSRVPETKIRGHAARTGNVHYSESDESEVEFLGKKPPKRPALGQIRMASNIQLPSNPSEGASRGRQPPPRVGQPPLPPGPPPSGPASRAESFGRRPPTSGRGRGSQGHPSSLPSKPPPPSWGNRNVPPPPPGMQQSHGPPRGSHRGGRGGRDRGGGRGGRGRGRGRP